MIGAINTAERLPSNKKYAVVDAMNAMAGNAVFLCLDVIFMCFPLWLAETPAVDIYVMLGCDST